MAEDEDNLINLRHDVDRHENDLDRQADDIRKLETFKDDMTALIQVVEYMWRCPQRGLPGQEKIWPLLQNLVDKYDIEPFQ
jgi:hypothetical protein